MTDAFKIVIATLGLISPIINYFIVNVVYCFMSVVHIIKIVETHQYCAVFP